MNHQSRLFNLLSLLMLLTLIACQVLVVPSPTLTPLPTETPLPMVTPAPTQTPNPFPNPVLKRVGDEEVVFDWTKDRCEALDIPDLAARAFRDDQGNVQLISAHDVNRRFIGPSLNTVKHDCKPIMQSASIADPSLYSYHQWLASPYTEDGKTIYALVHNEYYGSNDYVPCSTAFAGDMSCWYNAITLAVSTDGGASYHPATEPPGHVIASSLYPFEAGAGPYGFFEPSNIVKGRDGYYYAYMREHFPKGGNRASVCIMRTTDLGDASSWRAWDGKDFTLSFVNPYLKPEQAKSARECTSIPPDSLGVMNQSVTFNTYLNRYVMVGNTAIHIAGREIWGVLYSFSDDLIHWQPRKLLFEAEFTFTWQPGDDDNVYLYPSLLDPDSSSRNFETTGKRAYLYLTRFNFYKKGVSDPLDRDLIRIPVEFFPNEEVGLVDTNGLAWEFESEGDAEGWFAWNQLSPLEITGGHLVTLSTGDDPFLGSPLLAIDAKTYPIIEINMKVPSGITDDMQIFFSTDTNNGIDEGNSVRIPLEGDGEFHTYTFQMSIKPGWKGIVTGIRFDPVYTPAAEIEVDYIRIAAP